MKNVCAQPKSAKQMTPAIKILDEKKISYQLREYESLDELRNFGVAAATALQQDTSQVFKTLIAVVDGNERKPVVAVIAVADQLDLKKIASVAGGRKATLAESSVATRATGYVIGGISPIAQRQRLATFIDISAKTFTTIFVSGGKRGLQIELACDDLAQLTNAALVNIVRDSK